MIQRIEDLKRHLEGGGKISMMHPFEGGGSPFPAVPETGEPVHGSTWKAAIRRDMVKASLRDIAGEECEWVYSG